MEYKSANFPTLQTLTVNLTSAHQTKPHNMAGYKENNYVLWIYGLILKYYVYGGGARQLLLNQILKGGLNDCTCCLPLTSAKCIHE